MKLYLITSLLDFVLFQPSNFPIIWISLSQQFWWRKRKLNCEYLKIMIIIILVCRILDRIQYVTCLYVEEDNKINEWNTHLRDFMLWECRMMTRQGLPLFTLSKSWHCQDWSHLPHLLLPPNNWGLILAVLLWIWWRSHKLG